MKTRLLILSLNSVDLNTMALHPSQAFFGPDKPAKCITILVLQLFALFRFVTLEWEESEIGKGRRRLKSTTNLTILNAILVFRGVSPQKVKGNKESEVVKAEPHIDEYSLWWHVMIFQVFCSLCAFAVRYWLAAIVFP
jgi:UDP-N-acetylglucosamine--dolichyl-phosphate N-acetylglucosaminephosphotransferase